MNAARWFSASYGEARARFLRAAARSDSAVQSHLLATHRGLEDEQLATDVVRLGPPNATRLLITTSGTHGVEGFCGAAVQLALLHDKPLQALLRKLDVAILIVHAINPYGFSHLSRTTEDNIDLNRNGVDFGEPLPRNEAYDLLDEFLVPEDWPPSRANERAIERYIAERGERAYQQAVTAGQYTHADGVCFGGRRKAWSTQVLQSVFAQFGGSCERVGWIDFHAGLGPYGHGEKICIGKAGVDELQRARDWWGADVACPGEGTAAATNAWRPVPDPLRSACPHAETAAIAIEFGTVPLVDMLHMLRADMWLRRHPDAPASQQQALRDEIRAAFCCEEEGWMGLTLGQSRGAILQAVYGLSRAGARSH
ncbi:M14 family metallopeptidase [Variovorax robiniae]|uniref:M14 family metallopeptidase n=1 Tax=Variovorax robiniae TaxID=1836199 RepID=A0ABU8X8X8_9BURK